MFCLFCFFNGLKNDWMDFNDSFFILLTMDPEEVIVNFDFLIEGFINYIISIDYFTKNKERKIAHKKNTSV